MELSHFWRAIARHWVVAAVVFALCLAGSGYLAYSPADRFQATATMLVEPNDVNSAGDVAAVNFLIPALQVQLGTAATAQKAAGEVDPALRDRPVGVGSSVDPGTGILRVTTTGSDRDAVGPWANAYARALIDSQPAGGPLSIRTIDPATPPGGPSGPARTSTLVSGAVLGLILAVAAALLAHALGRRRRVAQEIRRRFGVPLLGEIPRLRRSARRASAPELLAGSDAEAIEQVMRVRAGVESQIAGRHLGSLSVTSYEFGEGKTFVVAALAWALSGAGRQVSVVEADLRRPALAQRLAAPDDLPAESADGLDGGLDGAVDRSVAPTRSPVRFVAAADLTALAEDEASVGAHGAVHPSDVVTAALPRALRVLERPDAVVVVDTPPLRHAAEAGVAARLTAGTLVVVDASRRRFLDTLELALAALDEAGAVPLGVVLTRGRRGRSRWLGGGRHHVGAARPATESAARSRHAAPLG